MRRNWGLFLILLVLALVWNEFFQFRRRLNHPPTPALTPPSAPATNSLDLPPANTHRVPPADAATNPPPVSLHVRNASLTNVIEALNTGMAVHMQALASPPTAPPSGSPSLFTLDAVDKPFWDIFAALNTQHPLAFAPTTDFTLCEAPPPPAGGTGRVDRLAVSGPFLLTISISRPTPPNSTGSLARYNLAYALAADPRMHPLEVSPELILGNDSAGNRAALSYAGMAADTRRITGSTLAAATTFQAAGAPGTRLNQIRLDARFLLAASLKHLDVENVEQKEGQDVTFAGATLSIKKFAHDGTGAAVEITTRASDDDSRRATFRLTDARGLTRWTGTPGTTANLTMADFAAPYRLHLEAPEKTITTDASFAIKDIELPQ